MLAHIIDWSGRNRFLVLLATLLVILSGTFAILRIPLDALPDLSDVQVIVYTEYPGQAPQVVEDQVTYPLTTTMLSVPGARTVRHWWPQQVNVGLLHLHRRLRLLRCERLATEILDDRSRGDDAGAVGGDDGAHPAAAPRHAGLRQRTGAARRHRRF